MSSFAQGAHSPQPCLHQQAGIDLRQPARLWRHFAKSSSIRGRFGQALSVRALEQQGLHVGEIAARPGSTKRSHTQSSATAPLQDQTAQQQQQQQQHQQRQQQQQQEPEPTTGAKRWHGRGRQGPGTRNINASPRGEHSNLRGRIKAEWQSAANAMRINRADPEATLLLYLSNTDKMVSEHNAPLKHVHINALLYGISQVWIAAAKRHKDWQTRTLPALGLQALVGKLLQLLEPRMLDVGPEDAADILWACALLKIHPDDHVPGTVDALGMRFLQEIELAQGKHYAHALMACARLQLDPCAGLLLLRCIDRLGTFDMLPVRPQHLQNIIYSLAGIPDVNIPTQVLDSLGDAVLEKLQSSDPAQQVRDQDVASISWSFQKLKHQPPPELGSAMISTMFGLIKSQNQKPHSQSVSGLLRACADLRWSIKQEEADALVLYLLSFNNLPTQAVTNVAWALAVMELLQPSIFKQLLQRLHTTAKPPLNAEMVQLYQALSSLEPAANATAEQNQAWSELQAMVEQIAPRPQPDKADTRGTGEIDEALTALGIPHTSPAVVSGYRIKAVVPPQKPGEKTVLISCGTDDNFVNNPDRATGRGYFFRKQLSKYGELILVPIRFAEQSPDRLQIYISDKIAKAAAGEALSVDEMTPLPEPQG